MHFGFQLMLVLIFDVSNTSGHPMNTITQGFPSAVRMSSTEDETPCF
jgi:hypothetical protein